MMSSLLENLGALIPSIGVLLLFVLVIRLMLGADRRERALKARESAEVVEKTTE